MAGPVGLAAAGTEICHVPPTYARAVAPRITGLPGCVAGQQGCRRVPRVPGGARPHRAVPLHAGTSARRAARTAGTTARGHAGAHAAGVAASAASDRAGVPPGGPAGPAAVARV